MNSESLSIFCRRSMTNRTALARQDAQIRAETESAIVKMLTIVMSILLSSGWSRIACLPPIIMPTSVVMTTIKNGTAALYLGIVNITIYTRTCSQVTLQALPSLWNTFFGSQRALKEWYVHVKHVRP